MMHREKLQQCIIFSRPTPILRTAKYIVNFITFSFEVISFFILFAEK